VFDVSWGCAGTGTAHERRLLQELLQLLCFGAGASGMHCAGGPWRLGHRRRNVQMTCMECSLRRAA